jgi:serine protease Do
MSFFTKCQIAALIGLFACGSASPLSQAQNVMFSSAGAYLGIQMADVTATNMSQYKLSNERGVIVRSVVKGSPAEAANLHEGDVILEFAGYPVWSSMQLTRLVQETPAGRKVEVVVSRDGKRMSLTAQIANRAREQGDNGMVLPGPDWLGPGMHSFRFAVPGIPDENNTEPPGRKPRLGLTLQPLTDQLGEFLGVPNKKGALIVSVASGSASWGKLKSGDVIIGAGGRNIDSPEDLTRLIRDKAEGSITLKIIRNKKETSVVIDLPPEENPKGYQL